MTIFEKVKKKADLCFISLVTWLLFFFFLKLDLLGGQIGTYGEGKNCVNYANFDRFFFFDKVKPIVDSKFWSHKKAMQIVLWFCLGD